MFITAKQVCQITALACETPAGSERPISKWTGREPAPARVAHGDRTVTSNELTGIQALECKHPGLPLAPGKVERREFEYIRHGTCTAILSRDVVTGQVLAPSLVPRRTEGDFLANVRGVVATDPQARQWRFVVDNLNTHQSEALVRWVAAESDLTST